VCADETFDVSAVNEIVHGINEIVQAAHGDGQTASAIFFVGIRCEEALLL